MFRPLVFFFILAAGLVGLPGCGQKDSKTVGQSVVKVGKADITVHQLNDELKLAGTTDKSAKVRVLDNLIDRQLLHNEALRLKMHRDPQVVRAIERAKAQILADSYLQQKIANLPKPSEKEIERFYADNPELFSLRKHFGLIEFVLSKNEFTDNLLTTVTSAKTEEEIASLLEKEGVHYASREITRTSADFPPSVVKQMHEMEKRQVISFMENERLIINFITDIKNSPVSLMSSRRQIAHFLLNTTLQQSSRDEIARLRAASEITYLHNEFEPPSAITMKSSNQQPNTTGQHELSRKTPDSNYLAINRKD